MRCRKNNYVLALAVAAAVATPNAFATNGMNMQGYGPVAYGMGGASQAYDNGVAAVMNNPATLGFMAAGSSRFDLALGSLNPDVDASNGVNGPKSHSTAEEYLMPAFGYARKSGSLTYGVGMFAQGGMGTRYEKTSFLAMGSGDEVGSQLGMGRLLIPLVFNITPDFTIGGSIDYVWATLDLKMAANGTQAGQMLSGCTGAQCGFTSFLTASSVIRVDFSDGDFTNSNGAAKGDGFAGKLGFAWKLDPAFSVGASYHSKTHLDDLKSDSGCLSAVGVGTLGCGKIKVEDFQWPAIAAIGMAWNVDPSIMVAADVKRIYWRDVMKNFKMTYSGTVNAGAFGLGTGDNDIGFTMQQDWENQTVYQLGGSWKASDPLTLRAGYNYAKSPIPPTFVNPLFPAIMEKHYTVGAGYALDKASAVDFGFAYAPQVEATNGYGVTSATGGTSFQLMYSSKF